MSLEEKQSSSFLKSLIPKLLGMIVFALLLDRFLIRFEPLEDSANRIIAICFVLLTSTSSFFLDVGPKSNIVGNRKR